MKNKNHPCDIGSYEAVKEFQHIMSHDVPIIWANKQIIEPRNSIGFWILQAVLFALLIWGMCTFLMLAIEMFKTGKNIISVMICMILFSGLFYCFKKSIDALIKKYHWVLNPNNKQLLLYCNNQLVRIIQVQQGDKLVCQYQYSSMIKNASNNLMMANLYLDSQQHGKIMLMSMQFYLTFVNDRSKNKQSIIQFQYFIRFLAEHLECPLVSDRLPVRVAD